MYALTIFIFSQWRSDENIRAIGEASVYQGYTKSIGAAAIAFDLARGVTGKIPEGPVAQDIGLQTLVDMAACYSEEVYPDDILTRSRAEWRDHLVELSARKQERVKAVLRPERKTPMTISLLVLTVFIWMVVLQYPESMLYGGLLVPELIRSGEYWRLLTPVFLHYEFSHVAFNMVSLYIFGQMAERIYGRARFLVIYLLAGIAGSLLSFAFNDIASLGASGAVFGLFGALLAFGRLDRNAFSMTIGPTVYAIVAINLVIGFLSSQVNNWGHIGGLIGGFLIARALGLPKREGGKRWLYAGAFVLYSLVLYGLGMNII
jgi:rhomboid protease GluP